MVTGRPSPGNRGGRATAGLRDPPPLAYNNPMNQRGSAAIHRILPLIAVVAAAVLLWRFLPSPEPEPPTDPLFALTTPELRPLLTADSDEGLRDWGCRVGFETVRQQAWNLAESAFRLPPDEFTGRLDEIDRYKERLARFMAGEFHQPYYINDLNFLRRFEPAVRQRIAHRRWDIYYLARTGGLEPRRKIEILEDWLAEAKEDGDTTAVAGCLLTLSYQFSDCEERALQREYLEAAIDLFRRLQAHRLTCQALGVLGDLYENAGDDDAMVRCYEEARRLAERGRLPDQAGRIDAFYAAYYRRTGRLALAHELYREAMRSCREFKGAAYEIRYICTAVDFYAELSAWDIVESLLERARALMRRSPEDHYTENLTATLLQHEARLDMALGRVEEGEAKYRELAASLEDGPKRLAPVENCRLWAEGLVENGRYEEAAGIAREGRARAEAVLLPDYAARMTLLAARAEFGRNRYDEASIALEAFDRLTGEDHALVPDEDIVSRDVLSARLALARGDTAAAVTAGTHAMKNLLGFIVTMDPSTHSYLWIERCEGVRHLWHDLTVDDPYAGYGLEFFWLDLNRRLGADRPDPVTPDVIVPVSSSPVRVPRSPTDFSPEILSEWGRRAEERIRRSGSLHCLYAEDGDVLRRWTLTADALRREDLPLNADACVRLAGRARDILTGAGGDGTAASGDELSRLAAVLLPPEVLADRADGIQGTLLVAAEGPISILPFEALDTDPSATYRPVLADWDVAYLRHADSGPRRRGGLAGLVVANPETHLARGQTSPFSPRLSEVAAEAHAAAAHDPGIRLMQGCEATKNSVRNLWEEAGFLYFAAHVTRDPRAPYLATISLAAPDSATGLESMHLSLEDIRRARFDACRLVVLSGCGSGLSYVTRFLAGPSLGDAFLDAGAAAAVETLWDVPDAGARRLMTEFTDLWLGGNTPPVHALAEVKRAALRESEPGDFSWATYVIELADPGVAARLP